MRSCAVTLPEHSPFTAVWRRYLRGEGTFAEFRRAVLGIDLNEASHALDAYRGLQEPIGKGNQERHLVGLATFAQHVQSCDAPSARAALEILVDSDICDAQRAAEFAELDAFCSGRFRNLEPFFAIAARYRLERKPAERLLVNAASTLALFDALDRLDWGAYRGCLLVVESGCHPLAVNLAARRCAPRRVVFESAPEQSRYESLTADLVNLDEYFVLNSAEEIACFSGVEQLTTRIAERCLRAPPAWLPRLNCLLDANRFAIEDSLYAASKRAAGLCDLIDSAHASGPSLLLVSQGRQLDLLTGSSMTLNNVHYFWCSQRHVKRRSRAIGRITPGVAAEPDAERYPEELLARLKAIMASYSRRERIRQWLRAAVPQPAIALTLRLLATGSALLKWRPRLLGLRPTGAALRWGIRRGVLDLVFTREVRAAMPFGRAPLDILFVTSSSPIYLETVHDLVRRTDTLALRTGIVVRSGGDGANKDRQSRTLDYLEVMQRPLPRRLHGPLAQNLAAHLRPLRTTDLMVLESRYGPLDLSLTIRQGMDLILTSALLRSHLFDRMLAEILHSSAPRRVVVAPDRGPEALSTIRECRMRHVPTWAVQTVYHSRHPRYKPLQADYTSLIDTWSFDLFRDHFGADTRRLFITGSPRMQLRIDGARPTPRRTILFICQRGVPFNSANLDYVLRNLDEFPDYDLLVRPHPSETPHQVRSYEMLLSRYPQRRATIDQSRPLREVMLEASVILVAYSNIGLEAACYSIPVLIINPARIDYPVALDEMGIGFRVSSDGELTTALSRLTNDPVFVRELAEAQRSYLDKNSHLLHGNSVERIVSLIVTNPPGDAPRDPLAPYAKQRRVGAP